MTDASAYWLSPRGDVIPVESRHLDTVIANLEKFGLERKYIDELFDKHGEAIGIEGNARNELMTGILSKNWIRLRYTMRSDMWTAQLTNFNKKKKEYIWDWVNGMLDGKYGKKYSKFCELIVMDEKAHVVYKANFGDVQRNFLESKMKTNVELCLIDDYNIDATILVETNLSRIFTHVNSKEPLAIISAFRDIYRKDPKINKDRTQELIREVRKQNLGYTILKGYWVENKGTPKEVRVIETSLFIVGNEKNEPQFKSFVVKMMNKFEQEAIIYKNSKDVDCYLLFADKEESPKKLGKWTPQSVSNAYSQLRNGKTFMFESAWTLGGAMTQFALHYGEKSKSIIERIDNEIGINYNTFSQRIDEK